MEKNVIIGTALKGHVRFAIANTGNIVEEARKAHEMMPTSLAALGRVLSVTALLGLRQKEEGETVTVSIDGGGPLGMVLACGDSDGNVKGFVQDNGIYLKYDNGKLAVGQAVGTKGYLRVTKNLKLKRNYTSQTELQSGEIGDDFAYWFMVSEQVPSVIAVGVLVDTDLSCKSAGALIIELLPGHTEEDIAYVEELSGKMRPISTVLAEDPDPEHYALSLFPEAEILERRTAQWRCDCSKDRFLQKLLTLPEKDLKELFEEGSFEVRCEFCGKAYRFEEADLKEYTDGMEDR